MGDRRYGLGIHSATGELGVGLRLLDDPTGTTWQTWTVDRDLLNQFPACLQTLLGDIPWSALAYGVVAMGPGSFTSVRIGVVMARTLAQQLDLPLFPVSTLKIYAQFSLPQLTPGERFGVTMPAVRGYLYGALYQCDSSGLKELEEDRLWRPEDWAQHLTAQGITTVLETPPQLGHTVPALLTLGDRAWQAGERPHWSTAEPFYGMSPTDPV